MPVRWEIEDLPQLHLYLPKELAEEVKRRADSKGMSVSGYLADLVKAEVADEWPEAFFSDVVGGWRGEPLSRPPQPPLETRDPLRGDASRSDPSSSASSGDEPS